MSLMESSSPEKIIINDYKLALKFFVNKDLAKSFSIVLKLHKLCYKHFELGTLREEYFIKIITLYLTEVGLLVNSRDNGGTYQLSRPEKKQLVKQLEEGFFLDALYKTYEGIANIPLELLFQIFLVNYTCQSMMTNEQLAMVKQFRKVYSLLDFESHKGDKYMKRWVDMYVFNVLPDAEDFTTAFQVAEENPLIDWQKAKTKLEELKELKKQEKKMREKTASENQSREAKRLEQDKARQRKAKDESDLKFKSLKQIRQEREKDERRKNTEERSPAFTLEQLKHRVSILAKASTSIVQKNSPVILVTILVAFLLSQFIRTRKINVREKLMETLKMAFKVTYL